MWLFDVMYEILIKLWKIVYWVLDKMKTDPIITGGRWPVAGGRKSVIMIGIVKSMGVC
jgi:hypothetical protein